MEHERIVGNILALFSHDTDGLSLFESSHLYDSIYIMNSALNDNTPGNSSFNLTIKLGLKILTCMKSFKGQKDLSSGLSSFLCVT